MLPPLILLITTTNAGAAAADNVNRRQLSRLYAAFIHSGSVQTKYKVKSFASHKGPSGSAIALSHTPAYTAANVQSRNKIAILEKEG